MNGFKRLITIAITLFLISACATRSAEESSAEGGEDLSALSTTPTTDTSLEADLSVNEARPEEALGAEPQQAQDEFAQFEEAVEPPPPEPAPLQETPQIVDTPPPPEPPVELAPPPQPIEEVATGKAELVRLRNISFKANESGGTVVIEGDGPLNYSVRMNPSSGQFIVDIPNTILPKKLTQPYITKDFDSPVGSIDAYQSPGSNITRVVVHLRPGSMEPVVQTEGNSILVVTNSQPKETPVAQADNIKLLSYNSLEEFLSGNMQFSGKKISIETTDMDLTDFFNFISEEAGINLVIGDGVAGKVNLKLRQVPWDQALVMVMRAKKLSYTKTGNILRIALMNEIKAEEDEAVKIANAKKNVEPLKVKLFPISYAKTEDIEKQVKPFLTPNRGTVVSDQRTQSVVVSDISENIDRIAKVIQSIDIPPQQVLIEGKVVEASENFDKQMGIQWFTSGKQVQLGDLRSTTSIGITPGLASGPTMSLNFSLGTLDFIGDFNAQLTLRENEGLVKVLSSPRIVTLHNEAAEISQTQELPIITSTTSNTGAVSPTVAFKPVRLKLGVTPQITNDGGVIMGVDVSREFAGEIADVTTQARPINSRTAKTKVLVRNGQTAVIGGVYQNDFAEKETKVPWISQVPVVGWMFKSKSKTQQKNELLIFLTPRILGSLDSQTVPQTLGEQ